MTVLRKSLLLVFTALVAVSAFACGGSKNRDDEKRVETSTRTFR